MAKHAEILGKFETMEPNGVLLSNVSAAEFGFQHAVTKTVFPTLVSNKQEQKEQLHRIRFNHLTRDEPVVRSAVL